MTRKVKLSKHGNAIHTAIPKAMLDALGWQGGYDVMLDLQENRTIIIRRPTLKELGLSISAIVDSTSGEVIAR